MKLKRTLSFLLAVVCIAATAVTAAAFSVGDVDFSGKVDVTDARLALRAAVKLDSLSDERKKLADFDGDGSVTVNDARAILRVAVGLDATGFSSMLYNTAHKYLGATASQLPGFSNSIYAQFYSSAGKWCCYYTVNTVFRPALENAGYSQEQIDKLAPVHFSSDRLKKAGILWPYNLYVPSMLMDYYHLHPEYCDVYVLFDYYDDLVEKKAYNVTDNADSYEPKVGDVLFISNKARTWVNGYPTIDHTAQIIKVNRDGTFLCTEGSIVEPADGDLQPRVRERSYYFNNKLKTYEYTENSDVIVLACVQPDYSLK